MKSTRTINGNQLSLYRVEWGNARRVLRQTLPPDEVDARRHALHVEALGSDKSSVDFTNEDLDEVLKRFRAISNPAGFREQIALADQPAKRARWKVTQLMWVRGYDEEDLIRLINRRRAAHRLVTVVGSAAATFETIGPADLERLGLDLIAECRAKWPRKGSLLAEIRCQRMEFEFDEQTTVAAVREVLPGFGYADLNDLRYEDLLKVIAVLNQIRKGAGGGMADGKGKMKKGDAALETAEVDCPF